MDTEAVIVIGREDTRETDGETDRGSDGEPASETASEVADSRPGTPGGRAAGRRTAARARLAAARRAATRARLAAEAEPGAACECGVRLPGCACEPGVGWAFAGPRDEPAHPEAAPFRFVYRPWGDAAGARPAGARRILDGAADAGARALAARFPAALVYTVPDVVSGRPAVHVVGSGAAAGELADAARAVFGARPAPGARAIARSLLR